MNATPHLVLPSIDPVITSELQGLVPSSKPPTLSASGADLVALRRGLRFPAAQWAGLSPDDKYRAYVLGVVQGFPQRPVISHESAAALWGLPIIGAWSRDVHILVPHASGGRSDPGIRRHAIGVRPEDVVDIDGLLVTNIARTVVDLATTAPVFSAVAAADAALWVPRHSEQSPRVTKAELWQMWASREFRGKRRAASILEFAETGAESPLESASRVNIALAGFPRPVLQHTFFTAGRCYDSDFYWPHDDAIGDCDGLRKYLDPDAPDARAAAEAVIREKRREDALRRCARRFTRWEASVALSRSLLRLRLLELGLRPRNHTPRHLSWAA